MSQSEHDGRRKAHTAAAIALFVFLIYIAAYEVTFQGRAVVPAEQLGPVQLYEFGPNVYALGPLTLPTRVADPLFEPARWIDAHVPGLHFHSAPPKP